MAPSPHRGLPIRVECLTFRSKRVGATVSGIWEESTGNSGMESGQNHPIAMYMLSITALFQNFCFWGVVSFYPLYLTGQLQYSEADATQSYGVFLGIATALPLLGGYASSYIKRYSISILLASLCLVLGCLLLSLNIESLLPFSLAFVALVD